MTAAPVPELEAITVRKLFLHLLPFLFLLYIVAYLDRINVSFAALQMREQLHLTDRMYGRAAGMFFAGYFLFQLPSNLVLERIGVRKWISALMVTWGLVSCCTIFVRGPVSFYVLRFLLGAAEAGFFPGMILYMKRWFPASSRARAVAWFMSANPLAGVFGSPISGALLSLHGAGLQGWQWLFVMEAVPAIVLGIAVYWILPESPENASWLSDSERNYLTRMLEQEQSGGRGLNKRDLLAVIFNARVWMLALVYFALPACMYGVTLWLPIAIHSLSGLSYFGTGVVAALPFIVTAVAMVLVGMHSDRTNERRWHIAIPAFIGAIALAAASHSRQPFLVIGGMTLGMMGAEAMTGPFWAMATVQVGANAAAAIAVINSIANLGGYFGPDIIGLLRSGNGQFRGLLAIGITLAISGGLSLVAGAKQEKRAATAIRSE
ncbi:MAG: major facilitator superfamily 1 [Acidobacteriaceae bacterium]|jgi:ACS family tartrate transporter-like MFS transporter|nr:major facilitator superfamily 1 [Acidobacteriaceae bacterium]